MLISNRPFKQALAAAAADDAAADDVSSAGVSTSSPVDDCVHKHLDGVAVCQQVNNVKCVPDYSHLQHHLIMHEHHCADKLGAT